MGNTVESGSTLGIPGGILIGCANALGTLWEYCDNAMVTAWEYQRAVLLGLAGCDTPRVSMVRTWEDQRNIIGII